MNTNDDCLRPNRYARRRAATLAAVYVLMGIHIAHWKLAGRTLAPLELNEVMFTLELGIITAGFLFMAAAVLCTCIFGRFFCSWGCHILALEDLCAWLLGKVGIRPKPIRSRVLRLVPLVAMLYMFVWPQVWRRMSGAGFGSLHVRGDSEGWASFVTSDFWRNLPGPWITALTFLLCGFAIVYLMGSRAFCTYACPYGALFRVADRFAPGRIVARGDCSKCGVCTAVCQSHVRVHEEVATFGNITNPACLKDLDCVAACPDGALRYGFTLPVIAQPRAGREPIRIPYDFTPAEDALMAAAFVVGVLTFRGLYDAVPFLMSLAIGGMLAYLAVLIARTFTHANLRLNNFQLKIADRLTTSGQVFAALSVIAAAFLIHCGFIRYHEYMLERSAAAVEASSHGKQALAAAISHAQACDRWGLVRPAGLVRRLASLYLRSALPGLAERHLRRLIADDPDDTGARCDLVRLLIMQQRLSEASAALAEAMDRSADMLKVADVRAVRGEYFAAVGDMPQALSELNTAITLDRESPTARYNLAVVLTQLGRADEAVEEYRRVLAIRPEDAEACNNLGLLLAGRGEKDSAAMQFRRAIDLKPDYANPYFNLARLLASLDRRVEATWYLGQAAQRDRRYAEFLKDSSVLASPARRDDAWQQHQ